MRARRRRAKGFRRRRFVVMIASKDRDKPGASGNTGQSAQMIQPRIFGAALVFAKVLAVSACNLVTSPDAPSSADLRAETIRGDKPTEPADACWATDETPAVIETITDQIAEDASPTRDAGYRTEIRQQIVQPREQIWFRTPCEAELTPEVVATLQRALAVRGFYQAEPNGELDAATKGAIRAFQMPRGLNSDRLSLAAARELGVVAADFGQDTAG
jgi:hypothetical protein